MLPISYTYNNHLLLVDRLPIDAHSVRLKNIENMCMKPSCKNIRLGFTYIDVIYILNLDDIVID